MLRLFVLLWLAPSLSLMACSPDRSTPTAPAGKSAQFEDLFGAFQEVQEEAEANKPPPAPADTTAQEPSSSSPVEPDDTPAATEPDPPEVSDDAEEPQDPFNIRFEYVDTFSDYEKWLIERAAEEWERLILSGFGSADDLIIEVKQNTRRSNSPCIEAQACITIQEVRPQDFLPVHATMHLGFDNPWNRFSSGGDNQHSAGLIEDYNYYVIVHEIGHALGLVGLLQVAHAQGRIHDSKDNDPYGIGGAPFFVGESASECFTKALLKSGYSYDGQGVPLAVRTRLSFSEDSARGPEHWAHNFLATAVMDDADFGRGGVSETQKGNIVSQIDAAALSDIGYDVDVDAAREIEIGYYPSYFWKPLGGGPGQYTFYEKYPPWGQEAGKAVVPEIFFCGNH